MKKKILIIPSWYPTPDNRLRGSFFQEQAMLLSEKYDIKVLYTEFVNHPAINLKPSFFRAIKFLPRSIISLGLYFIKFLFQKTSEVKLPDEEVFMQPMLIYHVEKIFTFTTVSTYKAKIKAYERNYQQLTESGWTPDVIHAQSINIAGLVAHRIKLIFNTPYVVTEHNPFNIYNFPKTVQPLVRDTFHRADLVLSISYDKLRQICMCAIDIEPNMVYNFVNEKIFDLHHEKYTPGDPLKIITVGAASLLKDHITLLKSLKIIKDNGVPFEFTFIGLRTWFENTTYIKINEFIESNNLKKEINFIDHAERSKIPVHLNSNNIFILTSIAEGLSVSVLEAMASGLIVVATKHGGVEDIITRETGILVNLKDHKTIAEKLTDIYKGNIQFEPQLIREHIVSICGTAAFSQRLSNYYEQVLQREE